MNRAAIFACATFLSSLFTGAMSLNGEAAEGDSFFETRVRPVLIEHCSECHEGEGGESGLRVDSLAGLLTGGDRGPAIIPGDPQQSLLIRALRHDDQLQMPPKQKLPPPIIADLAQWIAMGAPWPDADPTQPLPAAADEPSPLTPEEKNFWAFQPPTASPLPEVEHRRWVQSPIDAFILAQLEAHGLQPAPPADRRTLVRRAYFDLLGLPPTPAQVDQFLADRSPDAFARLVDRLLASPQYGERWGRRWLDVARYADSNGLDENLAFAHAWRYRDWVIQAWNQDQPFDQFVIEQIAGDLLPASGDPSRDHQRLIATGFLVLGAKMLAEDDPVKMEMDIIDEQVDTVGRVFMGMTLGCARCHDHKFDPIRISDYYAMAGIFKSTRTMENFQVVARWMERPLLTPAWEASIRQHEQQVGQLEQQIAALEQTVSDQDQAETGTTASDELTMRLEKLRQELAELKQAGPQPPTAMAVEEGEITNLPVHLRGSHLTLGREVPRGIPAVLQTASSPGIAAESSGRLQLAQWLTAPDHPLTSRVIANRLWQGHFGHGLVRSPDNFGRLGSQPTHPQLLDWLALNLQRSGWSLKQLHRTILLSSTWQMSSRWDERAAAHDPENELQWRMDRRRLEAEVLRDAMLAVSGELDTQMGGSLLPTPNRQYVTSTANVNSITYDTRRRSVYLPVVRSALYDFLQAFDFPDPSVATGKRQRTTVAPQALFLINSDFVHQRSAAWAQHLLHLPEETISARIDRAYRQAYGRLPTEQERQQVVQFLDRYEQAYARRHPDKQDQHLQAWQAWCRALLAANEFLYID